MTLALTLGITRVTSSPVSGRTAGEDVGPLVADLTRPGGTLAPAPPPVTHPALVADARFILKPQL